MKSAAAKVERLRKAVMGAQLAGAKVVSGLFKKPGEEGYNPDADVPWKEVTGKTRAALILTQGTMAAQRTEQMANTPRQLGVVVVHKRLEDTPDNRRLWEADAARLNDRGAIEAVAIEKAQKEPPEAA